MSDLISRQNAIDAMEKAKETYCDRKVIIAKMQDIVANVPSAEPQIIRCEDCKHSYDDIGGTYCSYGVCVDCVVDLDFFCRYGERREEE